MAVDNQENDKKSTVACDVAVDVVVEIELEQPVSQRSLGLSNAFWYTLIDVHSAYSIHWSTPSTKHSQREQTSKQAAF